MPRTPPTVTIHHFPSPEAAKAFAHALEFVNDSNISLKARSPTTVTFIDEAQDGDLVLDYREYFV